MLRLSSLITILPLAAALLLCIEASVHEYGGEKFVAKGNAFVVHGGSEGMYSSAPGLNESSPGDSFIRFEKVIFRRPPELSNFSSGSIHAVLFEVDDRGTIGGSAYGGQRAVCCTADLAKLGRLFCIQDQYKLQKLECITCTSFTVIHNLKILLLMGRLCGRIQPYARFWREVLPLQNSITLVITLGMFEMAFWYYDYAEFNETGTRPTGITVWAVTFGTVKRTVSRLIILIVSMGYGVVRPTLGGLTSKVLLLGGTFFVASEVLELIENVGAARRMTAKLDIYRKFTNALAVAVILAVGWICYELYFKSHDVYNEQWQNAWIIPAFWQVLSFLLLCVICALWAPSQNSTRYAYSSEDADEEFDRDETLQLIKPSPLASKDVRLPEFRSPQSDNGLLHGNLEEEKTA
ncbi:Transmembrane protein 87A [Sesamum angolense]|uniref:Transmembrane protein 87A n=1 Tax=Sesamum angolense TaxID=2727404 RepID=A0AAE1WKF0_9LAMI|nr:Transmembrane protein 87A [Sesamum angolense]